MNLISYLFPECYSLKRILQRKKSLTDSYSWSLRRDWKNPIPGSTQGWPREKQYKYHTGCLKQSRRPLIRRALGWLTAWRGCSYRNRIGSEVWKGRIWCEALTCLFPGLILTWLCFKYFRIWDVSTQQEKASAFSSQEETEGPSPLAQHTFSHATELHFGAHPELGTVASWEAQSRFFFLPLLSPHTGFLSKEGQSEGNSRPDMQILS